MSDFAQPVPGDGGSRATTFVREPPLLDDGSFAGQQPSAAVKPRQAAKRPWYFNTKFIVVAYFVFSPLGSLLILTDRRRGKKAKLRAAGVLLLSLTLLIYRIWFMPPMQF